MAKLAEAKFFQSFIVFTSKFETPTNLRILYLQFKIEGGDTNQQKDGGKYGITDLCLEQ